MRLVAVSIVKNEADIIEAFVRHTLAWVDHHLVFDHDSTDGTREWSTVGVSGNIIDASWRALVDSIEYYLMGKGA